MVSMRRQSGFSLVEMIGVLAIIAILAVIIVPKVFSTIASARITSAASSVGAIKSSITEFAGKYGTVPTTVANSRIDDLLFADGLMEGRFTVKIGTQPSTPPILGATWTRANGAWTAAGGASQATQSRVICLTSNQNPPAGGLNYYLAGSTAPSPNLPAGSRVISAVIVNCTGAEARELSLKIDGENFSAADNVTADTNGKVVYATPANGLATVYIYITHQ